MHGEADCIGSRIPARSASSTAPRLVLNRDCAEILQMPHASGRMRRIAPASSSPASAVPSSTALAGSGTAAALSMMLNWKKSECAPLPQFHVEEPGVTPRLLKVWLAQVAVLDSPLPEG